MCECYSATSATLRSDLTTQVLCVALPEVAPHRVSVHDREGRHVRQPHRAHRRHRREGWPDQDRRPRPRDSFDLVSPVWRRSRSSSRDGFTPPRRPPPPWSTGPSPSSSVPRSPIRPPSHRGSRTPYRVPSGRVEQKRRRSATCSACDGCDCWGANVRIVTRYPARHSGLT